MDKRFLLFVVSLSVTLLLVNFYFQYQQEEDLRTWKQAQKVKNEAKSRQLEEEIAASQVEISEFPIYEIYAENSDKNSVGYGYSDGKSLIVQQVNLPKEIYVRPKGSKESLKKYSLKDVGLPLTGLLYSSEEKPTLRNGELPDFGQFNLQVITLNPPHAHPAIYTDGKFDLLEDNLAALREEKTPLTENGIVAFKVEKEWLPVGLYNPESKHIDWFEEINGLEIVHISPKGQVLATASGRAEEQFYVLENNYQQLVISSYGGALAEINLPFQTKQNKVSVVKEVQIDIDMVKHHPDNALFPLHPYFTPGEKPEGPFVKNAKGNLGGYYPLIRRDLVEDNHTIHRVHPRFYALNLVSEYPEVAELIYEVKSFTKNKIVLEAKQSHRKITKTYSIAEEEHGGPYTIDLTVKIEGDSRGLWLTSGVPEVEWISGGPAPILKYRITRNQKPSVEVIDLPADATTISSLNPDWLCNSNGFFGLILDPLTEAGSGLRANFVPGTQVMSRLVDIDHEYDLYPAAKMPGYQMMVPIKNTPGTNQFRIFAGPFATDILKQVDATYSDPEKGYNPDYIACQTFHGWFSFISEPFAKFLFFLMRWFYYITGSWGFSIILLTVALRIMLYPLNAWSLKSTAKMQQIAPEVKAIQERHKKDPQKAQLEIVNLYRERGVNPLSGCLPLLIQMPFLIGMFDLLKSTFELRGASFVPGWINDLSAPDVLFTWKYPIFFIGNEFHLLPFLLGGVMFLQQRMMSPANASDMSEQQRQQRAMGSIMTIVFTVMFYNFPSGLNIYWLSSMLLGIVQQWWTNKQVQMKPAVIKK